MQRTILISTDLLLVALATVVAIMLRGNFDTVEETLITLMPYLFISVGCAFVVFLIGGLDRTPWRYNSVADHFQIIILTVLVILLALVITFFAVDRLESVARSLPVLQGALIVSFLVSARAVARFWYARRIHLNGDSRVNDRPRETIIVVGVNAVSELFLLSAREFASQHVEVAGILVEEPKMRGRAIHKKPVLGSVEELQEILQSLEVHGVTVNRIVVAIAAERLQPRALEILLEVEKSSNIILHFLSERLGFDEQSGERHNVHRLRAVTPVPVIDDIDHVTRRSFRLVKRFVDVFGAAFLIFTLSPLLMFIAFVVAIDVGFPVIFWQQRPGLNGRPFKLFKFRTMRAPHDKYSRRVLDDERLSLVGQLLRRARVDELPQLYNVLVGDMSFIGPRPLLPRDQPPHLAERLAVRPGITGWAQVNGGRIISPSEKWVLDIWYVQNSSLSLELRIVFLTLHMLVFGDRVNPEAVSQARSDTKGTLSTMLPKEMAPAE